MSVTTTPWNPSCRRSRSFTIAGDSTAGSASRIQRRIARARDHDQPHARADRGLERRQPPHQLGPRRRHRHVAVVGVRRRRSEPRKVLCGRGDTCGLEPVRERDARLLDRRRVTTERAGPEERAPRIGDVEDRCQVDVDARRPAATAPSPSPAARACAPSPAAPIWAADSYGGADASRFTVPPSWSIAISSGGCPPLRAALCNSATVARSVDVDEMFCPRRMTAPSRPRSIRLSSSGPGRVPVNVPIRCWPISRASGISAPRTVASPARGSEPARGRARRRARRARVVSNRASPQLACPGSRSRCSWTHAEVDRLIDASVDVHAVDLVDGSLEASLEARSGVRPAVRRRVRPDVELLPASRMHGSPPLEVGDVAGPSSGLARR